MVRVRDYSDIERAVAYAIDENNVIDLYNEGETYIKLPNGVDKNKFAIEAIKFIESIWSEPDVNFTYSDKDLSYEFVGEFLRITIK